MNATLANKSGRQKAAIREVNERVILAAAERVFAELGFAGASTGRIAELAGIPKANLHYYFPTKESRAHVGVPFQGHLNQPGPQLAHGRPPLSARILLRTRRY